MSSLVKYQVIEVSIMLYRISVDQVQSITHGLVSQLEQEAAEAVTGASDKDSLVDDDDDNVSPPAVSVPETHENGWDEAEGDEQEAEEEEEEEDSEDVSWSL